MPVIGNQSICDKQDDDTRDWGGQGTTLNIGTFFSHRPGNEERERTRINGAGSVSVPPAHEELWLPAAL